MGKFSFSIDRRQRGTLARSGIFETPHGPIETPAFIAVGTKGTVKALTVEQVKEAGLQAVLGNTYHLYLSPGADRVAEAGGLGKFMGWDGPTFTDSGGFQVFSLGAAYGKKVGKVSSNDALPEVVDEKVGKLAKIDEDGVTFTSHIDGSEHRFTPESSMEIQAKLGADIIFAFDECTSPDAPYEYQKEALERTLRWGERSLKSHKNLKTKTQQALFGIIQGGRFKDLREESARKTAELSYAGFGIGGSFSKKDIEETLRSVNQILPEDKPRHLLGIGEPEDLFAGVEEGIDFFDCVAPTRLGRNGTLYTSEGKINIMGAKYRDDKNPLDALCHCYTCKSYPRSYLSHLFRSSEMLASTLASIHNLFFITGLVSKMRIAILNDSFLELKKDFLSKYKSA